VDKVPRVMFFFVMHLDALSYAVFPESYPAKLTVLQINREEEAKPS